MNVVVDVGQKSAEEKWGSNTEVEELRNLYSSPNSKEDEMGDM
jgi:hypothetical protein